jgi:predicted RNase H-like HicB family nuclease
VKKIIQVRIIKGETHYVAECLDLPIVTQGKTLDEVAKNVQEAIMLHLYGEDFSTFDLVSEPAVLASIELEVALNEKT